MNNFLFFNRWLIASCLIVAGLMSADDIWAQEATDQPRPVARVYLLSGQSNMVGSGVVGELPSNWLELIDNVQFSTGGAFSTIHPGETGGKRFGPELGFAKVIGQTRPDQTHYIVKFAISGRPLHAGWDKGGWQGPEPGPDRATFYPGTSPDDPNIGNHYKALHQRITAAFEGLREAGFEPRLAGIAWMQGEADAKHEVSAKDYAQSLALLKKRLEQDFLVFGDPPVPLVFGQVLPYIPALDRFTHRTEIRQAMANADMRSGHEDAIPGCIMVPTEGMPLLKDTVHYNTEGQLLLGQAMGLAMMQTEHMIKQTQDN